MHAYSTCTQNQIYRNIIGLIDYLCYIPDCAMIRNNMSGLVAAIVRQNWLVMVFWNENRQILHYVIVVNSICQTRNRAFGNSGSGKLKRKTEMVKMNIVYFLIIYLSKKTTYKTRPLELRYTVHVSISHRL